MHTMQQLLFAQRFPFSKAARRIVEDEGISLAELPVPVVERAELMVQHAFSGKKYVFDLRSTELLMQELLAFPVAKILVSYVKDPVIYRKFSSMVADSSLYFLNSSEEQRHDTAVSLASDLGIQFDFAESKDFFVSIPLQEFLSIGFNDSALKLVNQYVADGKVFLDLNDFCRFLKERVFKLVLASLPVPLAGMPSGLGSIAARFKSEARKRSLQFFDTAFKAKVSPDSFPLCIASLYEQLAAGSQLPHMANFTLAAFLNSIGMPKDQILVLFKKAPNFKERVASYQISRICKQGYSPPSCEKIRAYGFCPESSCRARHPLSFYRARLRSKEKPAKAKKEESKK